ncbi:hypothetical protein [Flexivirga caeni]|uniref:Uncharacterized protein n=1 Tax=Flexivirga caeni TaxID=2294115 RepID=A0A3M9M3X2_9MICO|nr:hypothetical protein [Flexivirga caeni]RNI19855.1 hypothetical protein EFY87_15615 [Flexivirga caeni]
MSFDIYFQRFAGGDAAAGGREAMRAVLEPHAEVGDDGFLHVTFGDGTADVYLHDDGMLANHVSGGDPWELLVRGAAAADWVIMPVGCPACLTASG